jgi:tetratricopeptide (TPR) repeat protein
VPELTGLGSPAPADPESARFALFEAVVALLEVATAQQRTLLIVDDVQWAAPTTLLLLRHVIRSERALALLLVVTYRSTELQPDGALAELLADLQRDNSAQRIALTGLDERAIDILLRTAVGPALADQAARLVARVHAETAGNPFFVRELVAHLLESDALGGVGDGPAPATVDIPTALRDLVCHRVARLSQPAQQLMAIASVAAGAIDVALLKSVHAQGDRLFDALDEAVAAGLLVESERAEFDFAHALVRQAIYDHLSTARRLHLHRLLGEALEARGDEDEHIEALAHHFAQLALEGETDKAIMYAIAAGHAATARLAYEDAARHFQRGLDVLAQTKQPDAQRHVDLLLGVGHSRWSAGESDEARCAFEQAAHIAREIGNAAAAADAALGFCGPFYEIGATSTRWSGVLLQRALAMLDERDVALRARLMGRLAAAGAKGRGQHAQRTLAYDALALARAARDKHALTDVLATCCWATRGPDDPDHHLQMARELTGLAEEVGDAWLLANGHSAMIDHYLEQGDMDAVLHETDELQQLAQTRNNRYARWAVTVGCSMLAFLRGQLEHSESLALEALGQWADRPQFATPTQVFGAQMIVLRAQQGRLHEIVELTAANVEHAPEIPAWRCGLAELYRYLGDHERARHELDQLGDISSLPRDTFWLTSIASVGMVASYVNDLSRSRQAYELLLPFASTCVHAQGVVCTGSASRPLGMLATTLERYDEAELHFTRALEMNARIRSPLWTAHTQYEYARMLRLRDRPSDRDRADTLLATASATSDTLGLQTLGRRISAETYLADAA